MPTSPLSSQSNPKLLTRMRSKLRLGHYSQRTEQAYLGWVLRFVRHHRWRHPADLGETDVIAFLGHLAQERRVAVPTQGQALAALLFLYRQVLGRPLRLEGQLPRARAPTRLPVVLTRSEVGRVLGQLEGGYRLVGALLYGSGMRLLECLTLRVKDLDLERGGIWIRRGKGGGERGGGGVWRGALDRKLPNAAGEWAWQWVFPATRTYRDRVTRERRRH